MTQDERIAALELAVRALQDRQEIQDCLVRYCRGIDRGDIELALTAYHPDAVDDHGVMCGNAAELVTWAIKTHNETQLRTQHLISNLSLDIQGDAANCETYWHYCGFNKPPLAPVSLIGGRYLDRFERRNGRWGIAQRVCVIDWHGAQGDHLDPAIIEGFNSAFPPSRFSSDPSNKKPYQVDPARIGYRWKPNH
jgi:hypothetical protein